MVTGTAAVLQQQPIVSFKESTTSSSSNMDPSQKAETAMTEITFPTTGSPASQNKRKRPAHCLADTFSRVADSSKAKSGRGSEAGWVHCPLCGRHSRKLFALGRGIAAHLHAVHTPWNPGKVERQKRRRLAERRQREILQGQPENKAAQDNNKDSNDTNYLHHNLTEDVVPSYKSDDKWDPSDKEVKDWNQKVLGIVKDLEERYFTSDSSNGTEEEKEESDQKKQQIKRGVDRHGKEMKPYRASLPPFIQAAADGDLAKLKEMVDARGDSNPSRILELLNGRDRHLSTAEHWAAGSGHLNCLEYLLELRKRIAGTETCPEKQVEQRKKIRRRDGKTALHYAARNGHLDCIHYLINEQGYCVDEVSGDGTTPFHLSCFGGHLKAMQVLWKDHRANILLTNDFDCNAAHWLGMTKCRSKDTIRKMCQMLQHAGLSFLHRQKQGHTCLHKAAQHQNKHVIEWVAQSVDEGGAGLLPKELEQAGMPDKGGHMPSDIWRSVGGDEKFADWMQDKMGW